MNRHFNRLFLGQENRKSSGFSFHTVAAVLDFIAMEVIVSNGLKEDNYWCTGAGCSRINSLPLALDFTDPKKMIAHR